MEALVEKASGFDIEEIVRIEGRLDLVEVVAAGRRQQLADLVVLELALDALGDLGELLALREVTG